MKLSQDKYDFELHYEPFLLRPCTDVEGTEVNVSEWSVPARLQFEQISKDIGIPFHKVETSRLFPSTIASHALLQYAKGNPAAQSAIIEGVYKTFFADGIFIDNNVLMKIGKEAGLDEKGVKEVINDECKAYQIYKRAHDWTRLGHHGIPAYYMNGHRTFTGQREPEVFMEMFDQIAAMKPVEGPVGGLIDVDC